jgi:hypothetical protein
MVDMGFWKVRDAHELAGLCSRLSSYMEKFGTTKFPGRWHYFVGLSLFDGYPLAQPKELIKKLSLDWIHEPQSHKLLGSKSLFEEFVIDSVKEFLTHSSGIVAANDELITLRSWLSDPTNWGTSGSTKLPVGINLKLDGKKVKRRKSKWMAALSIKTDKLYSYVLKGKKTKGNMVQKMDEKGKVRLIVAGDDRLNLLMGYVYAWIHAALLGHPFCTLFLTKEGYSDMWRMFAQSSTTRTCKVRYDLTKFDHQFSSSLITQTCHCICDWVDANVYGANACDMRMVTSLIREYLSTPTYLTIQSQGAYRWNNGVLSGWRWTSLLDTIINYGCLRSAEKMTQLRGMPSQIHHLMVQADDVEFEAHEVGFALGIVRNLELMGLELKFAHIATDSNEFLKKYSEAGNIGGYPARLIPSLLTRGPMSVEPPRGVLRITELMDNWLKCAHRGMDARRVLRHAIRDIVGANDAARSDIIDYIHTPAAVGGYGLAPYSDRWLTLAREHRDTRWWVEDMVLDGIREKWDEMGIDISGIERQGVLNILGIGADSRALEFKEVAVLPPMTGTALTYSTHHYAAIVNPKLPITFRSEILGLKIEAKDYDWIRDVYLHPDIRHTSDRVEKHGGRGVWIAWLKGDWPFVAPKHMVQTELQVGWIYRRMASCAIGWLLLRSSFSMLTVKRAAVLAEMSTQSVLDRMEFVM